MNSSVLKWKRVLTCLSLVMLTTVLISCGNKKNDLEYLKLPEAPLFSGNDMWGVVREPYLRISPAPGNEEDTIMTLRRGEIVSVLVIQSFDSVYWCRIKYETREGWTHRDNLDIYESRAKALNGAILRSDPDGTGEP